MDVDRHNNRQSFLCAALLKNTHCMRAFFPNVSEGSGFDEMIGGAKSVHPGSMIVIVNLHHQNCMLLPCQHKQVRGVVVHRRPCSIVREMLVLRNMCSQQAGQPIFVTVSIF
jgi:hypothetical protein